MALVMQRLKPSYTTEMIEVWREARTRAPRTHDRSNPATPWAKLRDANLESQHRVVVRWDTAGGGG